MLLQTLFSGSSPRKLTVLERVTIVVVVVLLVAILYPSPQWVSDGSISLPVRIFVFDAVRGTPIPDAVVNLFRARPVSDAQSLNDEPTRHSPRFQGADQDSVSTNAEGTAVIPYGFGTGASHERPVSRAHLDWVWVYAKANGYGGVVVPLRHESRPLAKLRAEREIVVSIGLMPAD